MLGISTTSKDSCKIASQLWGLSLIEALSQTHDMLHSTTSKTSIEAYKTLSMAKHTKGQGLRLGI